MDKKNWYATIAGLIIAFAGVAWAVLTYFIPITSPNNGTTIAGESNVVVQGKNNTVISTPKTPKVKTAPNGENEIQALTTGWTKKYYEYKFGPAIFENNHKELKVSELIHSFPKFFLQGIFNEENKLIFYSITAKSTSFFPEVPRIGINLGKATFSEIGIGEHLYSHLSSKYWEYAEVFYFGNPGNYRNFYFAYNPAGTNYSAETPYPAVLDRDGKHVVQKMRIKTMPNTFGVGDILGDETQIIKAIGVGIEFYSARDIN